MRFGRTATWALALAVLATAVAAGAAAGTPHPAIPLKAKPKQGKESPREQRRLNPRQKRPNVIVIDTDDMNLTDLFVMRNTLSLLGAHGTTFANSYVSYPLCCPSRATFLTGQYAHNDHVITDQQFRQLDSSNTLAVWLSRAKYRTAMVGKYLNGYGVTKPKEVPAGWTEWFGLTRGTEQKRYGFDLNENGKVRHYRRSPRNYVDYVLDSKVNGLLRRWAISPRPFFLYYNPNNPHGERGTPSWSTRDPEPAPQYLGTLGNATMPRTPNFNEADNSDKPPQVRELPQLSDALIADIDRRYRGRLESLLSVDDEVKRIVDLVRKTGDERKTYIFFTSDNGLELGSHRVEFKNFLYEEGERVPLIIRGPGLPENVTRDQLVSNVDLAPTIVAITKARPGRVMDGLSLLPAIGNPAAMANRDLLFESNDIGAYGIRRGPWKYTQWDDGGRELYNVVDDPYELTNLLYDPDGSGPLGPTANQLALANQLAARLAQLRTCSGASCN